MTRISKQSLHKEVEKTLLNQFAILLMQADTKKAKIILHEFFTESEQIMFMKRLAIILMLEKGYSKYRIAQSLAVSESTAKLISAQYNAGSYDSLVSVTHKKDFDKKAFWETVEVILRAGLPSRGKDRWQSVRFD